MATTRVARRIRFTGMSSTLLAAGALGMVVGIVLTLLVGLGSGLVQVRQVAPSAVSYRDTVSAPPGKDLEIPYVNLDGSAPVTPGALPDKDMFIPDLNPGGSESNQDGCSSIYAALCAGNTSAVPLVNLRGPGTATQVPPRARP